MYIGMRKYSNSLSLSLYAKLLLKIKISHIAETPLRKIINKIYMYIYQSDHYAFSFDEKVLEIQKYILLVFIKK